MSPSFSPKTSNYKPKYQSTPTFIICFFKFSVLFVAPIRNANLAIGGLSSLTYLSVKQTMELI